LLNTIFCRYICNQLKTNKPILVAVLGKIAVLMLIAVSAAGAFATLGDGSLKKKHATPSLLLSNKTQTNSFSLRSGYSFRGSDVINYREQRFVNMNTVLTYQKGNTTYIVPLKKKVMLGNVKIELGNRQFRNN
jgi:hypothetical protein